MDFAQVVEGCGVIGYMDCCTCSVVDDDIFPSKEDRKDAPLRDSEKILPVALTLTLFDIDVFMLPPLRACL